MKKKRQLEMLAIAFILVMLLIRIYNGEYSKSPVDSIQQPVISQRQGNRKGDFTEVTATENNLYLAYSKDNCIDVYDFGWHYCYTIYFPKVDNGGFTLGSDGKSLYVEDKKHNISVFCDGELKEYYPWPDNKETGINMQWVKDHNEYEVTVTHEKVTVQSADGYVTELPTAKFVAEDVESDRIPLWIPLLILVGIVCAGIAVVIHSNQLDKRVHNNQ